MFDIIGIGEVLIDFTPAGISQQQNALFEANPGGSVANFTVAAARLGAKVAFMGKVGADMFGRELAKVLQGYGVNTAGLVHTDEFLTTLAFVKLYENGERDFAFYRKLGADAMLREADLDHTLLGQTKVLHFASLTLVNQTCYAATKKAVQIAKSNGALISYDPNWRPSIWESEEACRKAMSDGMYWADIVKVAENELEYITGIADEDKAAAELLSRGPRLVILTLGENGSRYFCKQGSGRIAPFPVKAVDATGAGDSCFGATLWGMIQENIDLDEIDTKKLEGILRFANATAALSVTGRGGMPSLPATEQVQAFIASYTAP